MEKQKEFLEAVEIEPLMKTHETWTEIGPAGNLNR
jgi:hypothetical protein